MLLRDYVLFSEVLRGQRAENGKTYQIFLKYNYLQWRFVREYLRCRAKKQTDAEKFALSHECDG